MYVFKEVRVFTRPLAAHPRARGCLGKESREHRGGGWWSGPAGGRRPPFPPPRDRATPLNPCRGRGAGPLLPQENSRPHTRLPFRRDACSLKPQNGKDTRFPTGAFKADVWGSRGHPALTQQTQQA